MFRAYDAGRERLVAVKLFRLDLPPEKVHQLVAAFEQLIAAELTHPALATPVATGMVGVQAYLAMEYAAAESLDLAVREYGPAPPADAVRVAAQLAGGLDFAAAVQVVHGCLHPRDVLLSADDTRLTGIGIARALEAVGVSAPIRRPYTAPERAAGQAWDRRADVFSLAALTHELLWGRRIAGHGLADGLTNLAGGDAEALREVFARALAADPHERFATALEFADGLRSAFPGAADTKAEVAAPAPASSAAPIVVAPQLPLEDPADPPIEVPAEAPALASDALELDLRKAEDEEVRERFRDVAPAPIAPPPVVAPAVEQPAAISVEPRFEAVSSPAPRSRAGLALAAIAAALIIGLAVGYGVGMRSGNTPAVEPTTTVADATPGAPPAAVPPAREATEVAVSEPPKATPAPPAVAPTPVDRIPEPRPAPPPRRPAPGAANRSAAAAPRVAERRAPPVPASASGTAGRYVGRLSVDSRPDGARVFLDGREVGRTPLEVATVSAGEHAIRLERDGYRRWSSAIRVVASERTRVTASLER